MHAWSIFVSSPELSMLDQKKAWSLDEIDR